ncbi:MAG: hypothetical protein V3S15_10490, partial [Woeseiaceae bacterium]
MNITPWPVLSALLWIVLTVTALYLARGTAHYAIRAGARTLSRTFRVAAKMVSKGRHDLDLRNREVL